MKHHYLIPALALLFLASCKKDDDSSSGSETCYLTSIRMGFNDITQIKRSPEGYLYASYPSTSYGEPQFFNGGTLAEWVRDNDTVKLDDQGRLASLAIPFSGPSGRQLRRYIYNSEGQVVRTHTNTFNGKDYLTDLVWQNGDLTRFAYSIAGSTGDQAFLYSYYEDKESPDQYSATLGMGQLGMVFNRHLIKRTIDPFQDTVFYSYKFDEQGRIKEKYTDRDGSGWGGYKRSVDTTYYRYTCY